VDRSTIDLIASSHLPHTGRALWPNTTPLGIQNPYERRGRYPGNEWRRSGYPGDQPDPAGSALRWLLPDRKRLCDVDVYMRVKKWPEKRNAERPGLP
jgi:hypothetical protein